MKSVERLAQINEAPRAVAKGEKKIKEVVASILESKEELLAHIKEAREKRFLSYSEQDNTLYTLMMKRAEKI